MRRFQPITFPVVAVGASAGGVEAIWPFIERLPKSLSAAVVIVTHIPSFGESMLDRVLGQRSALPVSVADDGEALVRGRVYVARNDLHLMIEGDVIRHTRGPKEGRLSMCFSVPWRKVAARAELA